MVAPQYIGTLLDPAVYLGFGWLGVPLFFVLSGYLLGGQMLTATFTPRYLASFWARRGLRIYPAVWAELSLLLLIALWLPGFISQAGMESLPLQFLLWINLPPAMAEPINLVWWTLPVELCFYFCLPLLGYLARYAGGWGMLALGVSVTMAWRLWVFTTADVENYLQVLPVLDALPGVFFTFMLGFCLNFLPSDINNQARRVGIFGVGIGLFLLLHWQLSLNHVYWSGHWILLVWPPLVACCIAGLVFFLSKPSPGWYWLGSPLLVWLGHVSFGIYLWHFQVFRLLILIFPDAWGTPQMSLVGLLVALSGTLIMATLSYYLIERPIIRWGARRLSVA